MTYAASAAPAPAVAAGTPVHTRWGWVTAFVPVAALVLSVVQVWATSGGMLDYFRQLAALIAAQRGAAGAYDPTAFSGLMASVMPMTLASGLTSLLSWGLLALGVVAAYLDYQELGRRGYPKRFHWAWNFLSPVYPIGRAVVVHRQAGAGWATLWIAASATAASFLFSAVWSIWFLFAVLQAMSAFAGTTA